MTGKPSRSKTSAQTRTRRAADPRTKARRPRQLRSGVGEFGSRSRAGATTKHVDGVQPAQERPAHERPRGFIRVDPATAKVAVFLASQVKSFTTPSFELRGLGRIGSYTIPTVTVPSIAFEAGQVYPPRLPRLRINRSR